MFCLYFILIGTHKQQDMTSASYTIPSTTTVTSLESNPYRDTNAGGVWGCGNVRGWGAPPSYRWSQFCASCPPCVVDRLQTRLAIRDNGYNCCNSEKYSFQPSWPWSFGGEPMATTGLESEPLWRELWDKPLSNQ